MLFPRRLDDLRCRWYSSHAPSWPVGKPSIEDVISVVSDDLDVPLQAVSQSVPQGQLQSLPSHSTPATQGACMFSHPSQRAERLACRGQPSPGHPSISEVTAAPKHKAPRNSRLRGVLVECTLDLALALANPFRENQGLVGSPSLPSY